MRVGFFLLMMKIRNQLISIIFHSNLNMVLYKWGGPTFRNSYSHSIFLTILFELIVLELIVVKLTTQNRFQDHEGRCIEFIFILSISFIYYGAIQPLWYPLGFPLNCNTVNRIVAQILVSNQPTFAQLIGYEKYDHVTLLQICLVI